MEMCQAGKPENVDLSSLTTIFSLGSVLAEKFHKWLLKMLPEADIFNIYGQTEVGVLTMFRKCGLHREYIRNKIGSVGVPYEGNGNSYKVIQKKI